MLSVVQYREIFEIFQGMKFYITTRTVGDWLQRLLWAWAAPQFWKWGDNFASGASQKIFRPPTFWPAGDKILLR